MNLLTNILRQPIHKSVLIHHRSCSLTSFAKLHESLQLPAVNHTLFCFSLFKSAHTLLSQHASLVVNLQEQDAYHVNVQAIDFPGGRVTFTPQIKFISESTDKRVPCYRVLDDDGPIAGSRFEQVDKETAVKMYKSMVTLQIMDHIFFEAQRQGRISFYLTSMEKRPSTLPLLLHSHLMTLYCLSIGSLGSSCGVGSRLKNLPTNCLERNMILAKAGKCLCITVLRNIISSLSSPIATQLPQAAGIAYSLKMDNKEACAVAFTGDGGTSEGDFHAGLNFAAVMEAPVLFICRNNGWAISTPISDQFRSDGVVVKGQAYGIRSIRVDGNDTLAVYSAIRAAREMVVREQKPILVEALTYRVGHHSTSDDSTKYRPVNEIEHWKTARNPLARFRKWVQRNGWWTDEEETELRGSIRKQVMNAIQVADETEKPSLKALFTDVYDRLPSNLRAREITQKPKTWQDFHLMFPCRYYFITYKVMCGPDIVKIQNVPFVGTPSA
ncbi:UNVERIFIED_CONTAM: 2-oxoisovalerate dehydrogenase subunit alpha 2, mitochondrial [Sesamum radiatum]|uniref:2-oxoisovalerate dehydrogenase subunit alpha 2, mitochondrial n=1 Tax=Sesamum radiatum TaxID=300843 RepID=A0AAW2PXR1_SESRA